MPPCLALPRYRPQSPFEALVLLALERVAGGVLPLNKLRLGNQGMRSIQKSKPVGSNDTNEVPSKEMKRIDVCRKTRKCELEKARPRRGEFHVGGESLTCAAIVWLLRQERRSCPDGFRVLYARSEAADDSCWVCEMARGFLTRLLFSATIASNHQQPRSTIE